MMKRILVVFCLIALHPVLRGQITMQTNLPKAVALNSEVTFDVKIKKGNTLNFAKYQMEVPRNVVIKEVDSKGGSFSFEDNAAKIIWVMVPQESEITISLRMSTGVVAGKKTFVQKYFYVENDDKKQAEMDPIMVMFKDSVAPGPSVSTSEFVEVMQRTMPSVLTTTINAAEISTKNPALLIQQVLQLRRDSRDAYAVGEREKKKAERKLAEANDATTKADAITDETERKKAQEKAAQDKTKAQNDLEVAERVLVLAKSLEDNANEIDKINKSVNPDSYSSDPKVAAANTKKNESAAEKAAGSSTTVNLDEKESGEAGSKESAKKSKRRNKEKEESGQEQSSDAASAENGLVYKIQLGAFSKEPSKKDFKAIGKVKISEEAGMYKVLYGSYNTKEEAFKVREEIISKGFDGFVVGYKDGMRVK